MQRGFPTSNQSTTNPGAAPPVQLPPGFVDLYGGIIRPTAHRPSHPSVFSPPDIRRPSNSRSQEDAIRSLGIACGVPLEFLCYLKKFVESSSILTSFHSYFSLKRSPNPQIAGTQRTGVPLHLYIHLSQEWGDDFKFLYACYELHIQMSGEMRAILRAIMTSNQNRTDGQQNRTAPDAIQPNAALADVVEIDLGDERGDETSLVVNTREQVGHNKPEEVAGGMEEINEPLEGLDTVLDKEAVSVNEAISEAAQAEPVPTRNLETVETFADEMEADALSALEIVDNEEVVEETSSNKTSEAQIEPEPIGESPEAETSAENAVEQTSSADSPVNDQNPIEDPIEATAEISFVRFPEEAESRESAIADDDFAQNGCTPPTPILPVASMPMDTMRKCEHISVNIPVTLFPEGNGSVCIRINQCKDRRTEYPTPSQACSPSSTTSPCSQNTSKRSADQMEQRECPLKTQRTWSWDGQSSLVEIIEGENASDQGGSKGGKNGRRESQDFMKEWFDSRQ